MSVYTSIYYKYLSYSSKIVVLLCVTTACRSNFAIKTSNEQTRVIFISSASNIFEIRIQLLSYLDGLLPTSLHSIIRSLFDRGCRSSLFTTPPDAGVEALWGGGAGAAAPSPAQLRPQAYSRPLHSPSRLHLHSRLRLRLRRSSPELRSWCCHYRRRRCCRCRHRLSAHCLRTSAFREGLAPAEAGRARRAPAGGPSPRPV